MDLTTTEVANVYRATTFMNNTVDTTTTGAIFTLTSTQTGRTSMDYALDGADCDERPWYW